MFNQRGIFWTTALLALALIATSCTHVHVAFLAGEPLGGRVPGTSGHAQAQNYITSYLLEHGVVALDGTTDKPAFLAPYSTGTNVVGQIPGTDLADEIVLVGGHYDHLADCDDQGGTPTCNGATDNAAGTAILLEIAAAIFDSGTAPRRTVMFAFWDEEERGLIGSGAWIAQNPTLVSNIVTYVNYDIQGANLLPSLANDTLAVGAETGGPALRDAVLSASGASTLDLSMFSLVFGQGRSDHARFTNAGVPTVFFTDSTGPCYHSTLDTWDVALDKDKLQQQRHMGVALVADLAAGSSTPTFATAAPLATFDDAVTINALAEAGQADIALFSPADQATLLGIAAALQTIVDNGEAAFDANALNTVLGSSLTLVTLLASGQCDGFVD